MISSLEIPAVAAIPKTVYDMRDLAYKLKLAVIRFKRADCISEEQADVARSCLQHAEDLVKELQGYDLTPAKQRNIQKIIQRATESLTEIQKYVNDIENPRGLKFRLQAAVRHKLREVSEELGKIQQKLGHLDARCSLEYRAMTTQKLDDVQDRLARLELLVQLIVDHTKVASAPPPYEEPARSTEKPKVPELTTFPREANKPSRMINMDTYKCPELSQTYDRTETASAMPAAAVDESKTNKRRRAVSRRTLRRGSVSLGSKDPVLERPARTFEVPQPLETHKKEEESLALPERMKCASCGDDKKVALNWVCTRCPRSHYSCAFCFSIERFDSEHSRYCFQFVGVI